MMEMERGWARWVLELMVMELDLDAIDLDIY
jgi:hypothetical protein